MLIELLLALGLSAALAYYRVSRKPDRFNVIYGRGSESVVGKLIAQCPSVDKEFTCSVIDNGHVSTILTYLSRPAVIPKYVRTFIEIVAVDWIFDNRDMLILIVPGLFTTSGAAYIANAAEFFAGSGKFDVGVLCFPGNGTRLMRNWAWFDTSHHIKIVMEYLATFANYKKVCLVGFSNGGNSVVRYVSSSSSTFVTSDSSTFVTSDSSTFVTSDSSTSRKRLKASDGLPREGCGEYLTSVCVLPDAAVTISQNFNASDAYRKVHRFYDKSFAESLKALIKAEWGVSLRGSTMAELEKDLTCRQFGFKNIYEAYDVFSSYKLFGGVCRPTLVIVAEDDPITRADYVPYYAVENENLAIAISKTGGHMGWSNGYCEKKNVLFPDDVNAADHIALEFVSAVCCGNL